MTRPACSDDSTSGGRILRTLCPIAQALISTPLSRIRLTTWLVRLRSGVRDARSETSSTPTKRPAPRTSPMAACPLGGIDRTFQETLWAREDAVAGEQRIDNQCGRLDAMTAQVRDRRHHVACEALGQVGTLGVIEARRRNQAHMLAEIDALAQ